MAEERPTYGYEDFVTFSLECLEKADDEGPGTLRGFLTDKAQVYATLALAAATAGPPPGPPKVRRMRGIPG